MLTVINDANLQDFVVGVKYLLEKSDSSEEVKKLATEITAGKPDPVKAIFDWVRLHVKYVPDPGDDELFISPIKMVESYRLNKPMEEDCDGFSLLTVALLRAIGRESNVCFVAQTSNGEYDHAVCRVFSKELNRYIYLDTSTMAVPCGWESKFFKMRVIE